MQLQERQHPSTTRTLAITPTAWRLTPSPRIADFELVAEAQRGSRRPFEELIRRYDRAVLRLALRLCASEAEAQDIYQEAFFKAYCNIAQFRRQSSFFTWIHRIVCNVCVDRLRARRSRVEQPLIALAPDGTEHSVLDRLSDHRTGSDPERVFAQQELRRHLHFALQKLTPRERMVFELKHFEGLQLRDVGRILAASEESAKNTLFRATRKLRNFLAHLRTA